nr:PAS domain-containing protein [Candidatus Poseidoniaceae archaeon]
ANLRSDTGDYIKYGSWNWNLKNKKVDWSDNMFELHGCDPKGFNPSGGGFMSVIHPDFRKIVEDVENEALESLEPFEYDYHIIRPSDGEIRIMRATGSVVTDTAGNAIQLMGIANDVTELSSAEKLFQNTLKSEKKSILESIGNYEIDAVKRVIHLSNEARAILGG